MIFDRVTNLDLVHTRLELLEKLVVDLLIDNRARAGRALLSLKTECRNGNTFDRRVHIGLGVHDDRVFAAHLEDGAFDPNCPFWGFAARSWISRPTSLEPVNAMKRVFGCVTTALPNVAPAPGQKFTTPAGMPHCSQHFDKLCRNRRRIARWLQDHRIAADDRRRRHARHDRRGKIPGRDYRADAERDVAQCVAFAG